jgi:membrane-bound serine protease (ClpP class)
LLIGRTGETITNLRPSGIALIDDQRVDVVAEGEFVGSGKEIVVVKVEGNRILVKEADRPIEHESRNKQS